MESRACVIVRYDEKGKEIYDIVLCESEYYRTGEGITAYIQDNKFCIEGLMMGDHDLVKVPLRQVEMLIKKYKELNKIKY